MTTYSGWLNIVVRRANYKRLLARNAVLEAALDDYLRVIGTIKALSMPFTMAERLSEVQLLMLELKAARDG